MVSHPELATRSGHALLSRSNLNISSRHNKSECIFAEKTRVARRAGRLIFLTVCFECRDHNDSLGAMPGACALVRDLQVQEKEYVPAGEAHYWV